MKSVEQDISTGMSPFYPILVVFVSYFIKGYDYAPLFPWPAARTSVLFDINKKLCVAAKDIPDIKLKPKGGILADEMGLGYYIYSFSKILVPPC
jgi:hypothetical protein